MNKVVMIGRLTKDVELRYSTDNKAVAKFNIAVNRKTKDDKGNYEADFIPCVAFGTTAEFISKYFAKGNKICITGRIQTGNYTNKEGQKVYTTDIVVEECEFVESKGTSQPTETNANNGFVSVSEEIESELPFN